MNISTSRTAPSIDNVLLSGDDTLGYDWLRGRRFRSLERMIIDEIVNRSGPGSLQHDLEHVAITDATPSVLPERKHIRLR